MHGSSLKSCLAPWTALPPAQRRRILGWAATFSGLLLLGQFLPWTAAGLWIGWNLLTLLGALGAAILSPRPVIGALPVILRWSASIAFVVALLARNLLEPALASWIDRAIPSNLLFFGVLIVVFPVAFAASFALSTGSAAIGARLAPQAGSRTEYARLGVRGGWFTMAGLILLAGALDVAGWIGGPGKAALAASFPWLLQRSGHWVARRSAEASPEFFVQLLKGLFVWEWSGSRGTRTWDLRAPALSIAAYALAASLNGLGLLGALQASVLTSLLQVQNALHHVPNTVFKNGAGAVHPVSIVIVDWDAESMRRAHTDGSEPAVFAEAIERLSGWNALRIVIPRPTLDAIDLPESHNLADVGRDDVRRARADLGRLAEAARRSGRVILHEPEPRIRARISELLQIGGRPAPVDPEVPGTNAAAGAGAGAEPQEPEPDPESNAPDPRYAVLEGAVAAQGRGWLRSLRVNSLPCIEVPVAVPGTDSGQAGEPVPWMLQRALAGHTNRPVAVKDRIQLQPGRTLGQVAPGLVAVDLRRSTPGHDFPHVTFGSVLRGDPVYSGTGTGRDAWAAPADFFAGRVVLLQPIVPGLRATPLGELPRTELLAYATQTLVDGTPIRRVPVWWQHVTAAVLALAAGLAAVGTTPVAGAGRMTVGLILIAGVSVWRALVNEWLDPVFPAAAAIMASMSVTQLTTTLDRIARDRNRGMLQRFVAPEVVAEMLDRKDGRADLGGQREEIVVLFADVRGFTQFAEAHPPEEVMRTVNAYLAVMTDALNRHGGMLDKYTGDGLMALFRLRDRGAEGVAEAVAAAVEMRDEVLRLSLDRAHGGDISLKVGISLHVGDAVLGLVGNPTRQINFTALGHTVVVAARLQAVAGGGEVVVSGEVAQRVGGRFVLEARTPLHAKGISQPLQVYRVG